MKKTSSVPATPAVEPIRWPDEAKCLLTGESEGACSEEPCACLLSEAGIVGALARDFYLQFRS